MHRRVSMSGGQDFVPDEGSGLGDLTMNLLRV